MDYGFVRASPSTSCVGPCLKFISNVVIMLRLQIPYYEICLLLSFTVTKSQRVTYDLMLDLRADYVVTFDVHAIFHFLISFPSASSTTLS